MRHLAIPSLNTSTVILVSFVIVSGLFTTSSPSAGGAGGQSHQLEISRQLPAEARLAVELVSADCVIESAAGSVIRLEVLHSYGEDRYQVDARERNGELQLRERFLRGSARGSATWRITVPPATEVLFSSASGDLESRGDYLALDASSAAGHISVQGLTGRILINTASADLRLREVAGQLFLTTVSGRVEISGFNGRLDLRTVSGDVELEGLAGEIAVVTTSGSIDVSELDLSGECSFNSASGDIDVKLAETPVFDLSLTSASGKVELDLNGNDMAGTYVFSALEHAGRIESPVGFNRQEVFVHAGQTYVRSSFTRGPALPTVTLATAAGSAKLKP
jgi:hypothetical protein